MNTLKKEKIYTIDDIYSLPDGERAELVDGQIYYMAPPNRLHQKISGYLHNEIYNYIKNNNGECEVYAAPFAVFLDKNSINYVEPDISVICDLKKWMKKAVMVHQTGLLKLFLLEVNIWIILLNYLNTVIQMLRSTGL